ncbi:glycosyltransferase [Gluconacetobacter sacchari]|uniref:Glycosyltransferase n=2 Tax=Gluconacetobacter sacchari TaxID=92759 RepID=A0A7W4NPF1_9PROT|nr:glycosyltransferase [Gluconacetobacter sacchari]
MSNMEGEGRVSVVIPLYNHSSYIECALESVIEQGNIVREVIVIDDGSQDDSLQIARQFAAGHSRIRIAGQTNCGAAVTLNRGVRAATAEYVAILNSDDVWAPNRLDHLVRALDRDAGLDLVASGLSFVNDEGVAIRNAWYEEGLDSFIARRDPGLALMDANVLMTTSNFVARRRVFDELGGFADLRYAHDMDFGLRLALNRRRIGFIDRELLSYRVHETNTIKENHAGVRVDWAMVASFFLWGLSHDEAANGARVQQAWQILEKHGLTRAAQACIAYFDANPSGSLATNGLPADADMKSKLLLAV